MKWSTRLLWWFGILVLLIYIFWYVLLGGYGEEWTHVIVIKGKQIFIHPSN